MAQTTHRASRARPDMVAVKSVGNGDISYGPVTLKQSEDFYESGQLLVREYTQSDPVGDPGAEPPVAPSGFDTAGTKYIALVGSDWKDFPVKDVAVNLYRTNATLGDEEVTAAVRLAEIVGRDTDLGDLSDEDQAAFLAVAATNFLIFG